MCSCSAWMSFFSVEFSSVSGNITLTTECISISVKLLDNFPACLPAFILVALFKSDGCCRHMVLSRQPNHSMSEILLHNSWGDSYFHFIFLNLYFIFSLHSTRLILNLWSSSARDDIVVTALACTWWWIWYFIRFACPHQQTKHIRHTINGIEMEGILAGHFFDIRIAISEGLSTTFMVHQWPSLPVINTAPSGEQ